MRPFSQVFDQTSARAYRIVAEAQRPDQERVDDLLAKSGSAPLTLAELAELLEIGRDSQADSQFRTLRAHVLKTRRLPKYNAVRYVAPIYVSSYCEDACPYCNFAVTRKSVERKRLSVEEIGRETQAVLDEGARVIELVYATDMECGTETLIRHVGKVWEMLGDQPGAGVLLCTTYLPLEAYEALHDAGLGGIVQWDETLDPDAYQRWHASSPYKRDFRTRIDNHDRAMAAGLDVAAGALFGLADYRYDVLMQVAKARHLAEEYGRGPFVFGVPRLKPIGGRELRFRTEVSDRQYEIALLVYSIAEPRVGRWLQTRETFSMNLDNMLNGDVFTYRCGDVTPGGYHKIEQPRATIGGQFGVNELQRESVEAALAAQGFRIEFAWACGRGQCVSLR